MPVLWSNPNSNEVTPAQLQSRYEVSAPNVSGVLGELMRQRQIQQQQLQSEAGQAIKGVADYVQKQKSDQIAQQFLDQASQYDNENPDATAQIARQLNETSAHPSDAWQAFQTYQQNQIKNQLEQAHAGYWSGMADYAQRGKGTGDLVPITMPDGTQAMVPAAKAMDYYYQGQSGQGVDQWRGAIPVARGKLDESGNFTNQYTGAEQGDQIKLQMPNGKSVTIPYSSWEARKGGSPQQAQPPSTPPQTSMATGGPSGKVHVTGPNGQSGWANPNQQLPAGWKYD